MSIAQRVENDLIEKAQEDRFSDTSRHDGAGVGNGPGTERVMLDVGCGETPQPGFVGIDRKTGGQAYPLQYPDGALVPDESVDVIHASHVLEHFSHRETNAVLAEWKRALKPGGELILAVPDFNHILSNRGAYSAELVEMYLMGGHVDDNDRHGAVFTEQKLTSMLAVHGLEDIQKWESKQNDCSRLPVSLNLRAVKRGFTINETFRTIAVLSQPRWAPTDAMLSLHRGLSLMRASAPVDHPIDTIYCGGAFWEKYLTKGIESALNVASPGDYLLFADYDGVYDPSDVKALIDFLQNNPKASVAFAVQPSRHNDRALVEYDHVDYSGYASEVVYGHFGLTAIRAEVFKFLPKPWLWSIPGKDQDWSGEGHCDADILFWRILAEHGHKVYQLNKIQIGHMDQCVKWVTPRGIMYQPIQHYNKMGRPKDAIFTPQVMRMDRSREQALEKMPEIGTGVPKPGSVGESIGEANS